MAPPPPARVAKRDAHVDAGELRQIDQSANESLRRTPQSVRIARAGRPLARAEHADDRVGLVGQRDGRPRRGRGAQLLAASAARRLRRRRAGSGSRSPSTPLRAGRPRGRRCRPSCPAARSSRAPCRWRDRPWRAGRRRAPRSTAAADAEHVAGNRGGKRADALGLLGVAAQLLVEQDRARAARRGVSSFCSRSASKKKRASRRRAVSTRSRLREIRSGWSPSMLRTARNTGCSLPASLTTGKKCWWWIIVVVSTSSGSARNSSPNAPETTFGYSTRSGTSCSSDWPPAWREHASAAPPRFDIELAGDPFLPLAALEHDEVLGEPLAVVVEPLDLDRAPGAAAGRQEAMAEGDRPRPDLLDERALRERRAIDRERHDAAAVEEQQPANRPAERQLALAVVERRVPAHQLSGTSCRAAGRSSHRAGRRPPPCRESAS